MKYAPEYGALSRINEVLALIGRNMNAVRPITNITLFLRSQYAYKTAVGFALAGQVVEVSLLLRSSLEYAAYALMIFDNHELEGAFFSRHQSPEELKRHKKTFNIEKAQAVIARYDADIAEKFKKLYSGSIDFGAHPNPFSAANALEIQETDKGVTITTLAMTANEVQLRYALKVVGQAGLTVSYVFQYVLKEIYEQMGVLGELYSIRQLELL